MKVKLFQGSGYEGNLKATREANAWLAANDAIWIINTQTAMCSIGSSEEIYQHFVITIFYDDTQPVRKGRR
jgi:hypothetical protein